MIKRISRASLKFILFAILMLVSLCQEPNPASLCLRILQENIHCGTSHSVQAAYGENHRSSCLDNYHNTKLPSVSAAHRRFPTHYTGFALHPLNNLSPQTSLSLLISLDQQRVLHPASCNSATLLSPLHLCLSSESSDVVIPNTRFHPLRQQHSQFRSSSWPIPLRRVIKR
jgi:hypothetical protein